MTISYEDFEEKLNDLNLTDAELAEYFIAGSDDERGLGSGIRIDPDKVDLESSDSPRTEAAVLFGFANAISRRRRKRRFEKSVKDDNRKILVTEGDSWFQFPFLLDDIVDHLSKDYSVYSVGAAGDTTKNMVFTDPEFVDAIEDAEGIAGRMPDGFLFSSGGNDILGEKDGTPVFELILNELPAGQNFDLSNAFVQQELERQLSLIRMGYRKLVEDIRKDFEELPIFFHAYDQVFPYMKNSPTDQRSGNWIQPPMEKKGIHEFEDQRAITTFLLGELVTIQNLVANTDSNVHILTTNQPLANDVTLWHDEIHPTSKGYGLVVEEFKSTLDRVLG